VSYIKFLQNLFKNTKGGGEKPGEEEEGKKKEKIELKNKQWY